MLASVLLLPGAASPGGLLAGAAVGVAVVAAWAAPRAALGWLGR